MLGPGIADPACRCKGNGDIWGLEELGDISLCVLEGTFSCAKLDGIVLLLYGTNDEGGDVRLLDPICMEEVVEYGICTTGEALPGKDVLNCCCWEGPLYIGAGMGTF